MLDMLTAIPDATILPGHAQQSPTTFAADVSFGFSAGGWSSLACVKHLTVSLRRGPLSGGFPVAAVFPVPWQEFGYRGLAKNRAQLFTLFALGNLFLVRRRLLA